MPLRPDLSAAKEALRIPELWRLLRLPGDPPRNGCGACRSPFREERHASFSIFDEGRAFHDHTTGEKGDAVEFLRLATGLEGKPLFDRFRDLAGLPAGEDPGPALAPRRPAHPPPAARRVDLSRFSIPTLEELRAIGRLRSISLEGLGLAVKRGFLRTGEIKGSRCWIVTEPDGSAAAARKLDGSPFRRPDGSGYKSHALTGKSWPLGLAALRRVPECTGAVMLCEGEADFLAAFHFIAAWGEPDLHPVAILGRTQGITPAAATILEGRRIVAFPHDDPDAQGLAAVEKWAWSIPGAQIEAFPFRGLHRLDGTPVNDLNDCTSIHPSDAAALEEMNPLPARHPCDDSPRLEFDHANRFRPQFWGRIQTTSPEGLPIVQGTACPF